MDETINLMNFTLDINFEIKENVPSNNVNMVVEEKRRNDVFSFDSTLPPLPSCEGSLFEFEQLEKQIEREETEKEGTEVEDMSLTQIQKDFEADESLMVNSVIEAKEEEPAEQLLIVIDDEKDEKSEVAQYMEMYRQARQEVRQERMKAESLSNQWRFYRNTHKKMEKRRQKIARDIDTFLADPDVSLESMKNFISMVKRRLVEEYDETQELEEEDEDEEEEED